MHLHDPGSLKLSLLIARLDSSLTVHKVAPTRGAKYWYAMGPEQSISNEPGGRANGAVKVCNCRIRRDNFP